MKKDNVLKEMPVTQFKKNCTSLSTQYINMNCSEEASTNKMKGQKNWISLTKTLHLLS